MFKNLISDRRRFSLITASMAVAALTVTGCGGGSDTAADSGGNSGGESEANLEAPFAEAPVADDSLILSGSTMEEIREEGTLVVGAALDAPLLSQQDPTNPDDVSGFDITLAKLLATYIIGEPNVEIVPPATETREALLGNGTVDVVFNTYTITDERAEQVSFAGPYYSSGLAVAVRADNEDITGIEDLGGKKVIVGANTPAVTTVPEEQPSAELVTFGSDPQAVQALLQERGDAYVQDIVLLASNAASQPDMKVVGQPFTSEPYGIGLEKGDEEFKEFINTWLETIDEEGLWGEVWQNSLGTVIESDVPEMPEIGSATGS